MKIKIDEDGYLSIERGLKNPKFKTQYCPYYAIDNNGSQCGDWCPLFGEPANGELETCKRIIEYDECIDERK